MASLVKVLEMYQTGRHVLERADPDLVAGIARLEEENDLAWTQENLPKLFDASLEGLRRVRDIIKKLRDFARLDEAELDELDVNAALNSTVDVLRRELQEKQISLETSFAELPQMACHPGKINQVFQNLLLNSIQASETEGTITLRTTADDNEVVVEIQDHGCGIDEATLPRIFEPFFTTKPVGRGTGLGLAICYGIISDHGGSIEVESEVHQGSTFRVRIPLHPPQRP
jgi:signal transduction histidine kinase